MGEWDVRLQKKLADNGMSMEEAARYVDDMRAIMKSINLGWRWEGKTMMYKEEWRKVEEEECITRTAKTAAVMRDIMNSLMAEISMTTETHEDFPDLTLPTLDTQVWMDSKEEKILYRYYEKPMSSKLVTAKQSAMGQNGKMASLSQELIRRMKNTNLDLDQSQCDKVIDDYSVKLVSSGYERQQVHRVITSGLRGFEKMVRKQKDGQGDIHKPASSTKTTRNRKKLLGRCSWFKDKKDKKDQMNEEGNKKYNKKQKPKVPHRSKASSDRNQVFPINRMKTSTVLFVEQTPNGELASRLREAEEKLSNITGFRVKVVEKNGTPVKTILHVANPWADGLCGRDHCYPCSTGDKSDCFKRGIVYTNTCRDCISGDNPKWYVGESARSSFERGGEHCRDYVRQKQDSHILKHLEVAHPGQTEPNFDFRVKGRFKSALVRQVTEAVMIRRAGESVLNSKGVYNRCYLPRLVVEMDRNKKKPEQERTDQDSLEWEESRQKRQKEEPTRRPGKKMKMDPTVKDNPRMEGIIKRRAADSLQEFQQECKRFRPEFDPGEEAAMQL